MSAESSSICKGSSGKLVSVPAVSGGMASSSASVWLLTCWIGRLVGAGVGGCCVDDDDAGCDILLVFFLALSMRVA